MGYAGFLLCCSWTAPHGLGAPPGPSQSLHLCPCTTPSLNCHLSFSSSKAQLSPEFGSPNTLSDFLGPTQPCRFPPSLGEPDGSHFNNRIGLKPRARLSPLTKFEVRLGLLFKVENRICDGACAPRLHPQGQDWEPVLSIPSSPGSLGMPRGNRLMESPWKPRI